nr:IS3 family transposase [Kibdelosporangium sp. MJ126-NF4]CEL13865.1 Mobile element protein [Kibdelosporangium sp. MJ126-NF4]CEL17860.1 Mobile element protein [Kibdelosporangium sp. MJ126-NF4]CEL20685.1 Mobile element protein [Kibdelosporangium sp. MJ126-NF4]CTQ88233.1 Mobile element protein [Kibdelosporangium sp. MJ126-NF4]CTQ89598.1 Mobile element protein [Kibdelosporangium sp. MJ126-NF4]
MNVYPFIEAEKVSATSNVKRACELLEVSRAAYYAQRTGEPSQRARDDAALTERIVAIHAESKGTYGAPRVHAELVATGWRCSRKRVARLMRAAGLAGRTPKRWRTTTVPDPAATLPDDLIRRDFACTTTDVNSRWCGDITYIPTWEGWLYLATVIDLSSRRVVGWATADHLRTDLVDQALRNAITQRGPAPGVIFHSDRGCQYTSGQYARLARGAGVRLSVGRKGQCWDNAVAESFFATIKTELLDRQAWPTKALAHKAIFEYIEGWYNTRRRHSSLGYLSPAAYEQAQETDTELAVA